jgi:hypothetical protein
MGVIEDIHKELDFQTYEPDLRKIAGVWKSIAAKQSELRKNPATAKTYKAFLQRCIKQLRENDPEYKPDEVEQVVSDLFKWIESRRHELGLNARELLRYPSSVEAWSEKHLKPQFDSVNMAWAAVLDRPSKRTLDKLKQAYEDMYQAYLAAYDAT